MRLIDADGLKEDTKSFTDCDGFNPVWQKIDNAPTFEITEEQAIDKLHETGWLIKHDKEMTERPQGDNKEALFVLNHLFYDCDNMTQKEYDILLEAIKERPQGKWIKQEWGYICSVCGESNDYAYDNNICKFTDYFCPHCGADMRGSDHEQK